MFVGISKTQKSNFILNFFPKEMNWKDSYFLRQELKRDLKAEESSRDLGFDPRDLRGRR